MKKQISNKTTNLNKVLDKLLKKFLNKCLIVDLKESQDTTDDGTWKRVVVEPYIKCDPKTFHKVVMDLGKEINKEISKELKWKTSDGDSK